MTFRSMAERFHKVSTWNKKMKIKMDYSGFVNLRDEKLWIQFI